MNKTTLALSILCIAFIVDLLAQNNQIHALEVRIGKSEQTLAAASQWADDITKSLKLAVSVNRIQDPPCNHNPPEKTKWLDLKLPAAGACDWGVPVNEDLKKIDAEANDLGDIAHGIMGDQESLKKRIAALERKSLAAGWKWQGPYGMDVDTYAPTYAEAVKAKLGGGSGTVSSDGKDIVGSSQLSASSCSSYKASINGDWKPIHEAPRDGTVIEVLETYGIAPWYGLYKWVKLDGNPSPGHWMSAEELNKGVIEDACLFWRPYSKSGTYKDPTNGAQNGVAYWCAAMHRPYDKKTDACR